LENPDGFSTATTGPTPGASTTELKTTDDHLHKVLDTTKQSELPPPQFQDSVALTAISVTPTGKKLPLHAFQAPMYDHKAIMFKVQLLLYGKKLHHYEIQ